MSSKSLTAKSKAGAPCMPAFSLSRLALSVAFAMALVLAAGFGQAAMGNETIGFDDVEGDAVNYLCFTAQEDNSTVKLSWINTINQDGPSFGQAWETSSDKTTWTDYTFGDTITLEQAGDKVYWRADGDGVKTLGQEENKYFQFSLSGKIAASGSIMTLLDPTDNTRTLMIEHSCKKYTFMNLFLNCTALVSAPELPATEICQSCYQNMFQGCTSLASAPNLPATELAYSCYKNMFQGCTSLADAPDLPAAVMENSCYSNMFDSCTSLTTMPMMGGGQEIAFDKERCCQSMFKNCSNLVVYSSSATGRECKLNCTSVTGTSATTTMFSGCSSSGDYHSRSSAEPSEAFVCYGTPSGGLPCARGDVNGNDAINIVDAQIVLDMANGEWTSEESDTPYDLLLTELAEAGKKWSATTLAEIADMNCSRTVDAADARAIQTYFHTAK